MFDLLIKLVNKMDFFRISGTLLTFGHDFRNKCLAISS